MIRIKILKDDRCLFQGVDEELVYENLKFQKERESIYVVLPDQKIRLSKNGARIQAEDQEWMIQLAPNPNIWKLLPVFKKITFGRDSTCDVSLSDPTISKIHFVLSQDHFQDLGSTNGTYINGIRKKECRLKPGDHIVFGNQELYWFDEVMVTGFSCKGQISVISSFSKPYIPHLSTGLVPFPKWDVVETEFRKKR